MRLKWHNFVRTRQLSMFNQLALHTLNYVYQKSPEDNTCKLRQRAWYLMLLKPADNSSYLLPNSHHTFAISGPRIIQLQLLQQWWLSTGQEKMMSRSCRNCRRQHNGCILLIPSLSILLSSLSLLFLFFEKMKALYKFQHVSDPLADFQDIPDNSTFKKRLKTFI